MIETEPPNPQIRPKRPSTTGKMTTGKTDLYTPEKHPKPDHRTRCSTLPLLDSTKVQRNLNKINANDHCYLKSLLEATTFATDVTLAEYVSEYEKIRAKKIKSKYLNIARSSVTVVDVNNFTDQFNYI